MIYILTYRSYVPDCYSNQINELLLTDIEQITTTPYNYQITELLRTGNSFLVYATEHGISSGSTIFVKIIKSFMVVKHILISYCLI